MVKRDGVGEQDAATVVPIVFGLNNLGAVRGYELSEVNLQALTDRGVVGDITFLEVLRKSQASRVGAVDHVHGIAKPESQIEPEAIVSIWGLVDNQFGHVQPELSIKTIKGPKAGNHGCRGRGERLCYQREGTGIAKWYAWRYDRWVAEVVGVKTIHEAGKVDRAQGCCHGRGWWSYCGSGGRGRCALGLGSGVLCS